MEGKPSLLETETQVGDEDIVLVANNILNPKIVAEPIEDDTFDEMGAEKENEPLSETQPEV